MPFIIYAHDHADTDALSRRMAVRARHLEMIDTMTAAGTVLYAAGMLDAKGDLAGSLIVADFPDRAAVDDYLKTEPYVQNRVWDKIEITQCRVVPGFVKRNAS